MYRIITTTDLRHWSHAIPLDLGDGLFAAWCAGEPAAHIEIPADTTEPPTEGEPLPPPTVVPVANFTAFVDEVAFLAAYPGSPVPTKFVGQDNALPVPASVGPAQFRIAMRKLHGITSQQVDAVIAQIADAGDRADAEDLWQYATVILRSHPLLPVLAGAFDLTSDQIDSVFRFASTL